MLKTIEENKTFLVNEGCSTTTLCEDGYTTSGLDMFENLRGFEYPKKVISYVDYKKERLDRGLDHNGYDYLGFDRDERNSDGLLASESVLLISDFNGFVK